MKFLITIYQDEDGMYIAECPAIPGCVSQGKTEQEAESNIQEAIKECLEEKKKKIKTGSYSFVFFTISEQLINRGIQLFKKYETRESAYHVSRCHIESHWGNYSEMMQAVHNFLLVWNQAFYRYGDLDIEKLRSAICSSYESINSFRNRDIVSLSENDIKSITSLFRQFYDSTALATGKKTGNKSPVSSAKALHILAPSFFPLWDKKIADAFGCNYDKNPAEAYIKFCWITKRIAELARKLEIPTDKSLIKYIDEYGYSKFTKDVKWGNDGFDE